jgi:hypothetical protein
MWRKGRQTARPAQRRTLVFLVCVHKLLGVTQENVSIYIGNGSGYSNGVEHSFTHLVTH